MTQRLTHVVVALLAAMLGLLAAAPLGASPNAAAEGRPFVYGITIAEPTAQAGGAFDLARRAGFTHVYAQLKWEELETAPGQFAWANGSDNLLDALLAGARQYGLKLILRLDRPPAWAGGSAANLDSGALRRFAEAVASRARGVATAYEVFNEPNLPFEFGGSPNPAKYAQLLAAANAGIKAVDPSATVLSAGMAPNTGGLNGTMEDVDFLRAMYRAGARGHFDALGIHPYGGNTPPETDPARCGICFRRSELYRQVMVEQGDANSQVWITEFGYLHTTSVDLGQYNWLKLSPQQQGDYIVRAYGYAYQQWPWLGGAVLFNLDFSTVGWTGPRSGMYWFALLNADRSPRAAYDAFKSMPKPGAAPSPAEPSAPPSASQPVGASGAPTPAPSATPSPSPAASTASSSSAIVCETSGRVAICHPADW